MLAASLVGYLGGGSAYSMIHKRQWIAHAYLAYNIVLTAIFLVGAFAADLRMAYLVPGITVGGQALGESGSFPRYLSMFITIPGTFFLLGGAIVSVWRFARKKEYAYRMWANVLIALGTLLIAWAGALARSGRAVGLHPRRNGGVGAASRRIPDGWRPEERHACRDRGRSGTPGREGR